MSLKTVREHNVSRRPEISVGLLMMEDMVVGDEQESPEPRRRIPGRYLRKQPNYPFSAVGLRPNLVLPSEHDLPVPYIGFVSFAASDFGIESRTDVLVEDEPYVNAQVEDFPTTQEVMADVAEIPGLRIIGMPKGSFADCRYFPSCYDECDRVRKRNNVCPFS